MNKRIKFTEVAVSIFASSLILGNVAFAATTATVTATVTAQNIAVSVSDGTVTYGTLAASGTADTTLGDLDDSQTATNDGNVAEAIDIQGQDSGAWTLGATAGSEQYFHKFCTATCDSTPSWTALTTSYQTLSASVAASGTQVFDLQIGVPSSTATFTQQSVDVSVQASAA